MHGVQLWINVPKENRLEPTSYTEYDSLDVVEVEENGIRARVISGTALGATKHGNTASSLIFIHFYMKKGSVLKQPIKQGDNVFIYIIRGTARVNHSTIVQQNEKVVLENNGIGDGVIVENDSNDILEFILLGGTPSRDRTVVWGPFAGNNEEDILTAFDDYVNYRNGFEKSRGWVSSRGEEILKGRRRYTNAPKLNDDGTLPRFNQKDYILPPT